MLSKILIAIATLASSVSFAQDAVEFPDHEIINEIIANGNHCVVGSAKDRIYLDPDRIFPTRQGMYLNLNDEDYMLLPTLNSDSQGCFIPVVQIFSVCPGCNQEYFISCKNPNCPLVKRSEERERDKERSKEEKKKEKERAKKEKKK